MLGSNKWILFTIVGGILISIHIDAIESPTKALIDPQVLSFTNKKLGVTIENLQVVPKSSRRQLRNLVPPYQEFSNIDGIQFIDNRSRNSKNLPGTFGTFRFENLNHRSSSPSPFRRRSDEYDDSIGTYPAAQLALDTNYDFDYMNEDNGSLALIPSDNGYKKFQNKIIPLTLLQPTKLQNEESTEGQQQATVELNESNESEAEAKESDERSSKQLEEGSGVGQIRFPDSSSTIAAHAEALTARRSGIHFAENESEIKPQNYNPFIPQSYSEESLNFGDAIPQFQRPFNNEDVVENENDRSAVGNRYYRPYIQPFRDEVTKFGDINGPVTAFNRPIRELLNFPRSQFEPTGYFEQSTDNVRPPRHFFPPKVFTEYAPDYTPPVSSKFYQPTYSWKTRQPRVVFPAGDFTQGTAGTTYVGNENVVFRDQNFGINDLAAVQDVRNDFTQQDIEESTVIKDKAGVDFIRTPRSEMECQHEGGTCEFFVMCWMSGGLLQGTCNGLMQGCCHRTAKSSNLGAEAGKTFVLTDLPNKDYGPVVNDASCGISLAKQTAQRRIVGGDDAGFGSFPWQAYIRIGSSRCGGSLVSRRHVVTAGHCVARATPRQVHVTLGDYVINSAVEPLPAYTFGVRQINVHPYFKFTPQADRFDVAVLQLERPVHFMPHIAPICLPEKNEDFLGKFGWAAGWGALNPGSRLRPKTLQAVDVPVIENRVCERWHRANGINVVIYPEMLCAGYRNGIRMNLDRTRFMSIKATQEVSINSTVNKDFTLFSSVIVGKSHSSDCPPRQCRLAILCWMDGGKSRDGCGYNPWLYSCCMQNTQTTVKKRNSNQQLRRHDELQKTFSRRRYDTTDNLLTTSNCGIPRTPSNLLQRRIIGGRPAQFAEFPWQSHIRIKEYQCGGALVSRKFVVTAGHCVSRAKLREIVIYLGELDTQNSGLIYEPLPAEKHSVVQKFVHPQFRFRLTQPDRFDIAALKLRKPAGYKTHILPICLPSLPLDIVGKSGYIAGWGKITQEHGHTGTNILRTASVPIISKNECIRWHQKKNIHVELYDEMICAGYKNKTVDACLGDSGGPLSILDNGRYYLLGITSAGFDCARPLQPGIYHNMKRKVRYCIIAWVVIALVAAITAVSVWLILLAPYDVKRATIRFENSELEFRVNWRRYDYRCWGSFYKSNLLVGELVELGNYYSIEKRDDRILLESGSGPRTWLWKDEDIEGTSSVFIDALGQIDIRIRLDTAGKNWYAGPQDDNQLYPVQRINFENLPFVTTNRRHIMERYWINNDGYFVLNDYSSPIFVNHMNELTFRANNAPPFPSNDEYPTQKLRLGMGSDIKTAHLNVINRLLGKPNEKPNMEMARHLTWNPSIRFQEEIDITVMMPYFNDILNNGFRDGVIDFDGNWEICEGSLIVDSARFPDVREFIDYIKANGFKVRFRVHPFVNSQCDIFSDAFENNFFVSSELNADNNELYHIDFTNPEAFEWFKKRLEGLQNDLSIDSFKFDGGESNLMPNEPIIYGNITLSPNLITRRYVELAANFGGLANVVTGWGTQNFPLWIRMSEFDSNWGSNNGIKSLIPRLLQLNMNGYVFVLSDFIGGNSKQQISSELYLRWLQTSAFMPGIQSSYGPWDFGSPEVIAAANKTLGIREKHFDLIESIIESSVQNGEPINRPLWWIDPNDLVAQTIDDQYLLGDKILVAPVLEENARKRDVYLPAGRWEDGNTEFIYTGPEWLEEYFAQLDDLPYFIRRD
ncbi:CLUMA_CG011324, isoform A [Clunio marinus]|uniref:CLUMA_CG011324, isoform A n=1 Tax=Clunio marinus TaxID=568069 RepID=A0A1J1ICJ4_9DIPT|nr:CLUMA_CG011324, isoform A [Clunio marinus]